MKKKRIRKPRPKPCKKCGRTLTDPKSIAAGMGKTCRMRGGRDYYEALEKQGQMKLFEENTMKGIAE